MRRSHGCAVLVHVSAVHTVSGQLQPHHCWAGVYQSKQCCSRKHGPTGFDACWDGDFGYDVCCTLPGGPPDDDPPEVNAKRDGWCGPVCSDPELRRDDRYWEAVRYQVLASLAEPRPEKLVLLAVAQSLESLIPDLPWASVERTAAPQCPVGSLLMRLVRGAVDVGGGALADAVAVAREMLEAPHFSLAALCGGWPLFRLLSLAVRNHTVSSATCSRLQERFFMSGHFLQEMSGAMKWTLESLGNCARADFALGDCLVAGRALWEELHAAQGGAVLGSGVCPPRSFAAWLDRMEPARPFPLCIRSAYNHIDDEIRRRGSWNICKGLAALAALGDDGLASTPGGCRVLDLGANVGACAVMLAQLGYRVFAFEPLPQNADLLEASLRLNGLLENGDSMRGAKVHRVALGDQRGDGFILEGKGNAGMSVVVPAWPVVPCDSNTFICDNVQKIKVERLDDIVHPSDGGPICLAKLDVEGSELRVLRGSLELLRSRALRLLHIEWWPPHLTSLGEEPAALLWFLHAMKYEIFAPASWFKIRGKGEQDWLMVVPDQFPFLLDHWGDIVARAIAW